MIALAAPHPCPRRRRTDWSGAEAALVAWFKANVGRVPAGPFVLSPGVVVTDPAKFVAALERDVARGPSGPRGAALVEDLAALQRLVEGPA